MNILSQEEEFEAALRMKADVDFIGVKMDLIEALEGSVITTGEYFRLFYIP